MIQNPNMIKAKYDGSDLVVIASSPTIPSWKNC
jgi:hypothetical protein